jgi:hypothetical protein
LIELFAWMEVDERGESLEMERKMRYTKMEGSGVFR